MIIVLFKRTSKKDRRGKRFERLTHDALKKLAEMPEYRFWFKRLYDYKTYIAVNPKLACFKQTADFMACREGQLYFVECKSSYGSRYDLKFVKGHQEDSAVAVEKAGAVYWLLIHHWGNEIYAFRPPDWFRLKGKTLKDGYVSATWEDLRRFATAVIRRGRGWDFSPLFKIAGKTAGTANFRLRKYKKKGVKYILSKEFPAVALYDVEDDDVVVLTDIWTRVCWQKWSKKLVKFIAYVIEDLSVTLVHELIHWGTEPTDYVGKELTRWEDTVENMAKALVSGASPLKDVNVIQIEDIGGDER